MEPQLPKPQFSPETAPVQRPQFQGGETFSVQKGAETESPLEQGNETREALSDGPQGDPVGTQPVFTPPPMPVVDTTQSTVAATADNTAGPATAADDDLIEREWVEKAKKVVAETRNDPHAQDLAIGRLQADYLKKRYGKTIQLPKDG